MNLNNQVEKNENTNVVIEQETDQPVSEERVTLQESKTPQEETITQEEPKKETLPVEEPEKAIEEEVSNDPPQQEIEPPRTEEQNLETPAEKEEEESKPEEPETEPEPIEPQAEPTEEKETEQVNEEKTAEKAEETDSELAQYIETFKNYKQGDIIDGMIVGISDNEVLVDISYKSEGSIPITEFVGSEPPKKGAHIKVYYERSENAEGKVLLSKKKADFFLALDKMKELFKSNDKINGTIKRRVRGGMIVDIMGIDAFLPGSQISTKPVPNLDHFIGKEMFFKIVNLDEEKKNIIVSRRKVMEEERRDKIEKLLEKIHIGAELDGEVKNITEYGAFVDLGGMDGLLHITDMTWGQINHPSEMLNISDKVKVKVIDYNPEEERISLGLKQLVPHPWEHIETKYEEGTKVSVKVVSLTHYGAFVEIEPGVEGLVHISEMSWTKKITNPKQIINIGDVIDAIVLAVSKDDKRISLGIKQMEPNPWLTIDERYPEGTLIKGRIKSLTPFGAFIELERDIDGLVHISDISWTKRISHPKEVLKKGQEVEAVIITIDKHLHRIALGIKQLTPDPWFNLEQRLPVNTEVSGKIIGIIPKGVLVQVELDDQSIEGFVPISHLAIPRLERPDMAFTKGDVIPMKVIELDLENRRLIFSVKAYLFSKDRETLQEFLTKYEPSMQKIPEKKEEPKKFKGAGVKDKSITQDDKKEQKAHDIEEKQPEQELRKDVAEKEVTVDKKAAKVDEKEFVDEEVIEQVAAQGEEKGYYEEESERTPIVDQPNTLTEEIITAETAAIDEPDVTADSVEEAEKSF